MRPSCVIHGIMSLCFVFSGVMSRLLLLLGSHLGVPVHVFGTETHMTAIVGMALGKSPIPEHPPNLPGHTATFLLANTQSALAVSCMRLSVIANGT